MNQFLLEIVLKADAAGLQAGLNTATSSVDRFQSRLAGINADSLTRAGQRAGELGRSLAGLSTVAAGVFAAATTSAVAYERSFSQITGLVGLAASEVDELASATLGLSSATGRGPQELAEAMFVIQSAGIQGAAGVDALTIAAQAAAIGMGTTRQNAQALTGALNAYASTGLTAAQAGDTLAATARAGNFEVSQLSGSLGRVLPVAAQMGVSFEQVGGAIALLTRNGTSARESITQIRAVLNSILAPSEATKNALDGVGLSIGDIRNTLETEGIVAALNQMFEAAGRNDEAFARMVGSQEAVGAAFTLLTADATTLENTFGQVANSTGVLEEALEATAATAGFQMEQALASIRVAAIQLGDVFLPVAAGIANGVADVAQAFSNLPGPVQAVVGGLIGVTAAAAPALLAFSRFDPLAASAIGPITQLGSSLSSAFASSGAVAGVNAYRAGIVSLSTAAEASAVSVANLSRSVATSAIRFAAVAAPIIAVTTALAVAGAAFIQYRNEQELAANAAAAYDELLAGIPGTSQNAEAATRRWAASLDQVSQSAEQAELSLAAITLRDTLSPEVADTLDRIGVSYNDIAQNAGQLSPVLSDLANESRAFGGVFGSVGDQLESFTNTVTFGAIDGMDTFRDRLRSVRDQVGPLERSLIDAALAGNITLDEFRQLTRELELTTNAFASAGDATFDTESQFRDYAQSIGGVTDEMIDAALEAARLDEALIFNRNSAEGAAQESRTLAEANEILSQSIAQTAFATADISEGIRAYALALSTGSDGTVDFVEAMRLVEQGQSGLGFETDESARLIRRFGEEASSAGGELDGLSDVMDQAIRDSSVLAEENDDLVASYESYAGAISEVERALDALNGVQRSSIEATIDYEDAFDGLSDSLSGFAEDGVSFANGIDLSTESGRRLAESLGAAAEESRNLGLAVAAETGSFQDARQAYNESIQAVLEVGRAAGIAEEDLSTFVRQFGELPDEAIVDVIVNTEDSRGDIERFAEELRDFDEFEATATVLVDDQAGAPLLDAITLADRFDALTPDLAITSNSPEVTGELETLSATADNAVVNRALQLTSNLQDIRDEAEALDEAADTLVVPRTLTIGSNIPVVTTEASTLTTSANEAAAQRLLTINSNLVGVTSQSNTLNANTDQATRLRTLNVNSNLVGTTAQANTLNTRADTATRSRRLDVSSNLVGATQQANTLNSRADIAARNRNLDIAVSASTRTAENAINNAARNRTATITVRTVNTTTNLRANGGIDNGSGVLMFNEGGIATSQSVAASVPFAAPTPGENHVAQIAPAGAWRVWAEPETGGEAYIPLSSAKRGRSMSILEQVAGMFGRALVPMMDGGVLAQSPSATLPNLSIPSAPAVGQINNNSQISVNLNLPQGLIQFTGAPSTEMVAIVRSEVGKLERNISTALQKGLR